MIRNTEPNFGITLENMTCFNVIPPQRPGQNEEALDLIQDGFELLEVPKEQIGIPLAMLEEANSVNVLAAYLGYGHLKRRGAIAKDKRELSYDMILELPPHEVIMLLQSAGFPYNGMRRMRGRGFTGHKGKYADRIKALPDHVGDDFMQSLAAARITHYAREPAPATIERVVNLVGEVYAAKHHQDFWWQLRYGRERRMKTRSISQSREGILYITKEILYNDNTQLTYACTCPAFRECKHIKEMKAEAKV